MKIRTGDKLYITSVNRRSPAHWCKVSSVGRKYFYVKSELLGEGLNVRFNINDLIHDNGGRMPCYQLTTNPNL